MPSRLVDRSPAVAREELIAGLVPPPLFADVRFDTYRPDPCEPSQTAVLGALKEFADSLGVTPGKPHRFRRRPAVPEARGIYLDGGFGVGKTHLLASLWHAVPGGMRLLAIDEFELDDPGDTVLVSTLLGRLAERGVALAATSNTLPDRLGDERFATSDFVREIQGLAARFTSVRVDGPDYRHRGLPSAPLPLDTGAVRARAAATAGSTLDDFDALMAHLATLHPSRYGALVEGVTAVHLCDVTPARDQHAALRLVVFADRLYDRQIPVVASGVPLDAVFDEDMLAGGYTKKYRRAISRLVALNRLGTTGG